MRPPVSATFFKAYKKYVHDNYAIVNNFLLKHRNVDLSLVYTQVEVYDGLTGQRNIAASNLKEGVKSRWQVGRERQSAAAVASNSTRLVLLGAPGSGKSTFMRSLALAAAEHPKPVGPIPIIVSVARLAAEGEGILSAAKEICRTIEPGTADKFESLLKRGALQIMVDGLDEVRSEYRIRIVDELNDLSENFADLRLLVTCRTAAYELWLQKFQHYEVSAFSREQVTSFLDHWYKGRSEKRTEIQRLIEENESVLEVCTSPLIATILCLSFDDGVEIGTNRAEIYSEAVDALLKRWDASKSVYRDNPYRYLGPQRRAALLAELAINTFVNDDVVFPIRTANMIVSKFLEAVPNVSPDSDRGDAEDVVKAIAAQHGLLEQRSRTAWAFSHLTFHEYFAAIYAVGKDPDFRKNIINEYFDNSDWKEVFSLIAALLPNADEFVVEFMRKLTTLNFGKEFLRRVDDELWRATDHVRSQKAKIDRLFSRTSGDTSPPKQRSHLHLVSGSRSTYSDDIIAGIQGWKTKVLRDISSIYDDSTFEELFHRMESERRPIWLGRSNASTMADSAFTFAEMKAALKRLWTPGQIMRIARSEEDASHMRARAADVIRMYYSYEYIRKRRIHKKFKEESEKKLRTVIEIYNLLISETINNIRRGDTKIKAYSAGEILHDILSSSAVISPPVRKAGYGILENFLHELPDPPDDGGQSVRIRA